MYPAPFRAFLLATLFWISSSHLLSQATTFPSGEITVRLAEGLDSATQRPGQTSSATVIKSPASSITHGSTAVVALLANPGGSGFSVQLLRITLDGKLVPASSSSVALTGLSRVIGLSRGSRAPQNAVSGGHVFLPSGTEIRLVLAPPSAAATAATAAPSTAPPPPAPAAWRLLPVERPDPQNETVRATLSGTATGNGAHGPAALTLGCTTTHFTNSPQPSARLVANLRVRAPLVALTVSDFDCEGDMDGSYNAVFTTIGSQPPTNQGLCIDSNTQIEKSAIVDLQLGFGEAHFTDLLNATSQPLSIKVVDLKTHQPQLEASFTLPADDQALKQSLSSCLSIADADAQREKEATVVACPVLDGKLLQDVKVLQGPSLRPAATTPDNDIGISWDLPATSRAHPVRPKLVLICSYALAGADPSSKPADRQTFPIPASAKTCVFRHDRESNQPFGRCQTSAGTGY